MAKNKEEKKKKKSTGWDDIPESGKFSDYRECYERFSYPNGEWSALRLVGDVVTLDVHWVPTLKKDGKETAFAQVCRKNLGKDEPCPNCKGGIKIQSITLSNAIIRDKQEDKPGKKKRKQPTDKKFREKDDKFWSPIGVVQFPPGAAQKVKNLGRLNKAKDKKTGKTKNLHLNHPRFGRDISVMYDPTQSGTGMYDIQRDDRMPLTPEEKSYLLFNLEKVYDYIPKASSMVEALQKAYNNELFDNENCNMKNIKGIVRGKINYEDGEKEEDLKDMNSKQLLKFAKEKKIKLSKKEQKLKKKKLRELIEDRMEKDNDNDDNDNDNNDDDLSEMSEKELVKFAKSADIPLSKKEKKLKKKKLRKLIESRKGEDDNDNDNDDSLDEDLDEDLDNDNDDNDNDDNDDNDNDDNDNDDNDNDNDDLDDLTPKELLKYAKKNKIKLSKKEQKLSKKKLKKLIESKN